MKKFNFNQYFVALIIGVSLIAFIFLNTVNVKTAPSMGVKCEQPNLENEEKNKNSSINLPSIDGAKTIILLVKKFIPAS